MVYDDARLAIEKYMSDPSIPNAKLVIDAIESLGETLRALIIFWLMGEVMALRRERS